MPRQSPCAVIMTFQSWCSIFAAKAIWRRSCAARAPRRQSRTEKWRSSMAAYDKADLERRMAGSVEALRHDLGGLRTGRASTSLLDPATVAVYGAQMPLNQVATVSVPEPRMLSVQVW